MKIFGKDKPVERIQSRRIFERHRKAALGEVDYPDHVMVKLPVPKRERQRAGTIPEPEIVWVKIMKGTKLSGHGVIDTPPLRATQFKVGTVIRYHAESASEFARFVRVVHIRNQAPVLKAELAADLVKSLTFQPEFGR